MQRSLRNKLAAILLLGLALPSAQAAGHYNNFAVSVYVRSYEVRQMSDLAWLKSTWDVVEAQAKPDKVYLETFRDGVIPDEATIAQAKQFFASRGVRVAAGIATVANERNRFQSLCYSTPADRQRLKEVVEYTARQFDEIILDDFFYTNCKCERCIAAKGDKSWTQFRLEQMDEVARELVVKPAKAVNPKVKVVLKFPNWYEHYQGLGYNLEAGAKYFDGIYTGTETREPFNNAQHLQQYQGYLIVRYLENAKPGANGGGWVDGGMGITDRYAEQLWLTLFAKAPEITLFDLRQIQQKIETRGRAPWQDQHPSFDFDQMMAVQPNGGAAASPATVSRAAGYTFEQVDAFLGKLGRPLGLPSYKPFHSDGEDFVHTYLGMVGIPFELTPRFPTEANMVFLAESAAFDPALVNKIKRQLLDGKSVVITSGLLRALQGKGIEDIAEIRYTDRKIAVKEFGGRGGGAGAPAPATAATQPAIIIPELDYITNDVWMRAFGAAAGIPYPLLLEAGYAKGTLYVLTIPENFGDLYNLPASVLTQLKSVLCRDLFVQVEAPAQVSLFVYDNGTFIVESFLPDPVDVRIVVNGRGNKLRDLQTNEILSGQADVGGGRRGGDDRRSNGQEGGARVNFQTQIKPHSFRVFQCEP